MAFRIAFVASLALAAAEFASPVGKVVSLLGEIQGKIEEEGKAEDVKIAEYKAVCERRKSDLGYQIKTAKSDIEEMSARSSKAQSKAEVAASTIGETQESLAGNEADLQAATEVRQKESVDFRSAENELLDVNSALERAMSALEKEEKKGSALVQVKGAPGLLKAVQAMMDASMIGHEDAATLTNLLQNQDSELQAPAPAVYKSKSGGVIEMLEDMLDKSKDQVRELRRKESEAKHSFEMVKQSLEDEMGFAKKSLEKAQKIKAEQSRSKAEADKDLQQTKISLAEDEQTLSDFVADCQQEVAAYEDETKSRALEMEALKTAKAALMESSGMSFLQLEQVHDRSSIRNSQDLKHFEVVRLVRSLGQKLGDHELVLLSRRMDSMLRTEAGASADVFEKIKTMITDMIATMKENLQADATKKAYCDSEMGKASDKKATKEADMDSVSTKIDSAASKSASLKKEVADINKELAVLAETEANMTKLRQEEKSLFAKKEPETLKGMEGVKTALRSLRDFYKASGVEVTSGERKGAAGGVISRLEDVEADMAMSLSQMRSSEKTAEMGFKKDMQDMKIDKSQKEKDIQYKTQEAQRLDSELNNLNSDQESLETEMGALMEFTKGLEAECLVTPESFAEKQAKRQQEIEGLKEALDALDATSETPSLIQRQARGLRGKQGALLAF